MVAAYTTVNWVSAVTGAAVVVVVVVVDPLLGAVVVVEAAFDPNPQKNCALPSHAPAANETIVE